MIQQTIVDRTLIHLLVVKISALRDLDDEHLHYLLNEDYIYRLGNTRAFCLTCSKGQDTAEYLCMTEEQKKEVRERGEKNIQEYLKKHSPAPERVKKYSWKDETITYVD